MKKELQITPIAEENKILRGYLRDILDIVGHGSTFSDDCPAEMLAYIVEEVAGEIEDKDNIIEATDALRTSDKHFIKSLNEQIDNLTSDLGECRMNLREADAPTDKYGLMLGRIGQMIPVEFFRTPESTVEQAVALLLDRYYSEMATNMYNQNQKIENQ